MPLTRAALIAALLLGIACDQSCGQASLDSTSISDFPARVLVRESPQIDVENAIGLDQLQAFAMANNPSLSSAASLISAARGRAYQNGLQPNPRVGVDFQQLASGGRAEQYGVTLGQDFVRGRKLDLNRAIGMQEVHRLEEEYRVAQLRVLTDVQIAYVRGLRAQRQIDVSRELLAINWKALDIAQQLLNAKEVARTDVLRAEVEVENAQISVRDAELRHMAAWREIQAVTGQPSLPATALAGDLFAEPQELDFDATLAELQMSSPEIASLAALIERARCNLRRQQVEPMPDVRVDGLVNWRDNGADGDGNVGLAVSVPLPIRDKNLGAIQEARFQFVSASQELERLRLALKSRLATVYERYASAKQRVEGYQNRIIPKAEETVSLVRTTYELGEVNFDTVLQTQRTYAQTRLAYIDALEQLRLAEAEIDGLLLSGSLSSSP